MDEKKMRIDYEIASGYAGLKPRDRDFAQATEIRRDNELKTKQATFERHRAARVQKMEEDLTKHYKHKIAQPRPANAPPSRIPTRDEIKAEAVRIVDERHRQEMDEVREQAQKAVRERVERSLEQGKGNGREH